MIRIGLTGGIGSGKTYVCRLLQRRGIPVYHCDDEAKRLMVESPVIRQQIFPLKDLCDLFPAAAVIENCLDRGPFRSFTDKGAVSLFAEDDRKPVEKDALARSGLSGQHRKAPVEFEFNIWKYTMPRYGFTSMLPLKKLRCSAAKAASCGFPRNLEDACNALGVAQRKDAEGGRAHEVALRSP